MFGPRVQKTTTHHQN